MFKVGESQIYLQQDGPDHVLVFAKRNENSRIICDIGTNGIYRPICATRVGIAVDDTQETRVVDVARRYEQEGGKTP